ncbi:hypothetical protein Bbelb_091770 [Branchiostoma belcheri]|nr:hypothetical protein Bbelb_091770 [Branchiostoma belcheri]
MDKNRTGVLILLLVLLKVLGPTEASCSCKDQTNCNCKLQGLGNLDELQLDNNNINEIQAGAFTDLSSLSILTLQNNNIKTFSVHMYDKLLPVGHVNIANNPWQCDCRMLPLRKQMTGARSFEEQITCYQPEKLKGQQLKDINPADLICYRKPKIVRFERNNDNNTSTKSLVCEASGVPTPDITVVLPSGLNVTVQPEGGETVATISINVTADAAGLYICTAASPLGNVFATLSVELPLDKLTSITPDPALATSPLLTVNRTSDKPESSSSPILVGSVSSGVVGAVLVAGLSPAAFTDVDAKCCTTTPNNTVTPSHYQKAFEPAVPDLSICRNNTATVTGSQDQAASGISDNE